MRGSHFCLAAALMMVLTSPQGVLALSFQSGTAQADRSGYRGPTRNQDNARPQGLTWLSFNKRRPFPSARPNRGSKRPVARPTIRPHRRPQARPRPSTRPRPSLRPNLRPNRPNRPGTSRPSNGRPPAWNKPNRPGTGLPSNGRPPAWNKPNRPGAGVPGNGRPPAWSKPVRPNRPNTGPPGNGRPPAWNKPDRPGSGRPPGWRPPHWRPPHWRPPFWRPPFYRPHHPLWGRPYWFPGLGWYHSYPTQRSTLVIVLVLPSNCDSIYLTDESLYVCGGILFRETYLRGELVYEVITNLDDLR